MTRPLCRHCCRKRVNRPRGLCWPCYYRPGLRDLYPSTSRYARRGVGNYMGTRPLPPEPTATTPGSGERIEVLHGRARDGFQLFHPADVRLTNT